MRAYEAARHHAVAKTAKAHSVIAPRPRRRVARTGNFSMGKSPLAKAGKIARPDEHARAPFVRPQNAYEKL